MTVDIKPLVEKEEIKKALSESQEMVGEKTLSEGIFHMIFRGYMPLNLLSNLKFELEGEEKEKIEAYCYLIRIALRRSYGTLQSLGKGYGTDLEEIKFKRTAFFDHEEERRSIERFEKEVKDVLNNPSNALSHWLSELNITKDFLSVPIVNPFEIDESAYVTTEVLVRMSRIGLFRLKVPREYGGLGFSQKGYDMVLQTLSHISGTLLAIVSAHNTIGSAPLLLYGTKEQKQKYLREVAEGNYLAAFGLTEPTSGTDALGKMKCTAKLSDDGKDWIINGEKIYITNIHRSGLMYMMAKTDLGQGLSIEEMKPTVFIVELPFRITDSAEEINKKRLELLSKGMRMSKPLELMMIRGSNQAHIIFENFRVPKDHVLGEIEGGSKVIFNSLNKGRAGFGASSAEAARYIFETALKHTTTREMFVVFGGRQCDLPQVKSYISKMAASVSALRAVSDMTTAIIGKYGDSMNIIAECAAIKILATEGNWDTATYAMRLWGGTGTMRGHFSAMELAFRDAWIGIIVEGVNEAMKQLVTGVGVQAVKNDADTISRHIFYLLKPFMWFTKQKKKEDSAKKKKKVFKPSLFGAFIPACFRLLGALIRFEKGKLNLLDAMWLQYHTKLLSLKTAVLGMKYGNKMLVKQLELIRMSDIAMDLYSLSAVFIKLKAFNLNEAEKEALKSFIVAAKRRISYNLKELTINNKNDIREIKVADLWIKECNTATKSL